MEVLLDLISDITTPLDFLLFMIIKDFQDIKSFLLSNLDQDESLLEIVVEDTLVIVIDIIKGLADISKSHENQYSNDTQNHKKNDNHI